jgi:ferredoxin
MALVSIGSAFRRSGIITLTHGGFKKQLAFMDNDLLFTVMDRNSAISNTGHCFGNRGCGKCKVIITNGPKKERSKCERIFLGDAPEGTHLACDLRLTPDFDGAVLEWDE